MIRDIRTVPDGGVLEADLCIVGCGAAGIAMATSLAGAGMNVCVLESGGLNFERDTQDLSAGTQSGLPYFSLAETSCRGLGGNTSRWGARSAPLQPIDFTDRSWVPHSGWPLSREELDPYYRRVSDFLGLHHPFRYEGDVWENFGTPPPGFDTSALEYCAFQFGKKLLLGQVYRRQLDNAGNVTVYLGASVQQIRTTPAGDRVDRLELAALDGRPYIARADKYVLACGGIENPRLLLLSRSAHPDGLCNQHDLVGRFFMEHPTVSAGTVVSDDWQALHDLFSPGLIGGRLVEFGLALSPALQATSQSLNAVMRTNLVAGRDSTQALRELMASVRYGRAPHERRAADNGRRLRAIARDPIGIVQNVARHALGRPKRFKVDSLFLEVRTEQEPDPESRVTLSDQLDRFGQPRAHLHWSMKHREKDTVRVAATTFREEVERLGLGTLKIADWLQSQDSSWPADMVGGHHHMGTTRMSDDPRTGVVDRDCKAHGVENLYVVGSSVFPTAGYANPTSTVLALAFRLAEHLEPGGGLGAPPVAAQVAGVDV
jgi:choline dehydrogenase-like flavoprotein